MDYDIIDPTPYLRAPLMAQLTYPSRDLSRENEILQSPSQTPLWEVDSDADSVVQSPIDLFGDSSL